MDIVLINTGDFPVDKHKFDSVLHGERRDTYPLGLLYVATVLHKNGYSPVIIDFSVKQDSEELETAITQIIKGKPKIIGVSVLTQTFSFAQYLVERIRQESDGKGIIIAGGYHPTFAAEEILQKNMADIVVRGEGEDIITQLVDVLLENEDYYEFLPQIPGLSYKKNGVIVHNAPLLNQVPDLDQIPFPERSLLTIADYRNPGIVVTSRGCIGNCNFCVSGHYKVRMRSPENVAAEVIDMANKYQLRHIDFVDDNFTVNKKRAVSILNLVRDQGLKLSFSVKSRVDHIDQGFIEQMAEGGVNGIQFGVESGNEKVLKDIKKNINLQQVDNAVEWALKAGIDVYCSFIIGHPTDTLETINDTILFAKKLRRKGANCYFAPLTPFPGTEVFNKLDELGVTILDWNYSRWSLEETVIKTGYLTKKEIANGVRRAYAEINAV